MKLPFYIAQGDTTNDTKIQKNFEEIETDVTTAESDIDILQTTVNKLNAKEIFFAATSQSITAGSGWTDINTASGTIKTTGGNLVLFGNFSGYETAATGGADFRYKLVDGATTLYTTATRGYWNALFDHQAFSVVSVMSSLPAATYTVTAQIKNLGSGGISLDTNDQISCIGIEIP